jgi:hypothetical protein
MPMLWPLAFRIVRMYVMRAESSRVSVVWIVFRLSAEDGLEEDCREKEIAWITAQER